ncbi:hypothetical protein Nepgr_001876 [Nepenthes gracilis]|uniref:Uncharacterized protein n=1 Tax=Nepenthes gracilis TaxID=150966 RepID=A0AAD3P989_NEPGR|nr:hypothetical protein Nepgr_001876 [Nepenthes gracilis]
MDVYLESEQQMETGMQRTPGGGLAFGLTEPLCWSFLICSLEMMFGCVEKCYGAGKDGDVVWCWLAMDAENTMLPFEVLDADQWVPRMFES